MPNPKVAQGKVRKWARSILVILVPILFIPQCILESKLPSQPVDVNHSDVIDSIYPSGVTPSRTVNLYQPLLDTHLSIGEASAPQVYPGVNVKEKSTGMIVKYRLTRQRFGTWDKTLEFKWNYFLLQSNFLFPESLPDTSGMAVLTKNLYDSIHIRDRFTKYFDSASAPSILNVINTSTKGGAIGISIKLPLHKDTLVINQVVKGSPADKAGLKMGMGILEVNDSNVVGDSAIERFKRFSAGDSGVEIRLKLKTQNGEWIISMIRVPVSFPTVLVDSLSNRVGYISISGFTPQTLGVNSTYTEFRDALLATKRFPITLLDLRDNGGGSLDIAIRMCDEILPAGAVIIRQRQRRFDENLHAVLNSEITSIATSGGVGEMSPTGGKRKYLLLANDHSASASEILLVSVIEGAKAPLMGIKTFGKGVGQTVRNTPGNGLALVTFLKFTSASGLDYHTIGLIPDYLDSASGDSLLINATLRAEALLWKPPAKSSSELQARSELTERAALIEWNRREALLGKPWRVEFP